MNERAWEAKRKRNIWSQMIIKEKKRGELINDLLADVFLHVLTYLYQIILKYLNINVSDIDVLYILQELGTDETCVIGVLFSDQSHVFSCLLLRLQNFTWVVSNCDYLSYSVLGCVVYRK